MPRLADEPFPGVRIAGRLDHHAEDDQHQDHGHQAGKLRPAKNPLRSLGLKPWHEVSFLNHKYSCPRRSGESAKGTKSVSKPTLWISFIHEAELREPIFRIAANRLMRADSQHLHQFVVFQIRSDLDDDLI